MKFLTKDQKDFYDKNGFVVVDIFTDDEIEELSQEYDAVFERKRRENMEATWGGDWSIAKHQKGEMKSIHAMQLHSAAYSRLLLHPKMLDACEDVMQTPNILLHHAKSHLKPPGKGSPFPMHQDYHYFPFKNDSMVAVFISLDASDPENGGLCVYPGSQLLGPQKDVSTAEGWHYIDQTKFPLEKATPLRLGKGQVAIFSYLLVHGSFTNASAGARRMHLIQLVDSSDEPLKAMHSSPCQGMVLRGVNEQRHADISKRFDLDS